MADAFAEAQKEAKNNPKVAGVIKLYKDKIFQELKIFQKKVASLKKEALKEVEKASRTSERSALEILEKELL